MSQLGISIGIAVLAVISNTITDESALADKESPDALMQGFRVVFWTCFAMMVLSTVVGAWGLRGWKKIGTTKKSVQATSTAKRSSPSVAGTFKRPVIKRKALPPGSAFESESTQELTQGYLRGSDLNNKALPEIPRSSKLPTVEETSFEDTFASFDTEAGDGIILEHILKLYDRSQISLAEVHDIFDEY